MQGVKSVLGDVPWDWKIDNELTRYYENCEKYVKEVEDNPETVAEEQKWKAGPEMAALAETLTQRLNLSVSTFTPGETHSQSD